MVDEGVCSAADILPGPSSFHCFPLILTSDVPSPVWFISRLVLEDDVLVDTELLPVLTLLSILTSTLELSPLVRISTSLVILAKTAGVINKFMINRTETAVSFIWIYYTPSWQGVLNVNQDLILTNSIIGEFIATLKDWKIVFEAYPWKVNYATA